MNSADYIQHTFDTEMIIPMAEDFEFMDNINEILAVEGVDAINFGPADYSMSTNRPSGYDMKNSDTDEVLRSIAAAGPRASASWLRRSPPMRRLSRRLFQRA